MRNQNISNVVVHDAARPFIRQGEIRELIDASRRCLYAQFHLKLLNGLLMKGEEGYEVVDREKYIELVTPMIIDYRLAISLFENNLTNENCEIIPFLEKMKINYELLEGSRFLRKITTIDDL